MANKDIFNSNVGPTEAWSLDGAIVQLGDGTELLVQTVSVQYARSQAKLKPINSNKNIIIVGSGEGTVTMSVIVGPGQALKDFLTQYSDPCKISENVLTISAAVSDACHKDENGGTKFICSDVLASAIGVNVSGSSGGGIAMISGTLNLTIGSLQIT